MPVFPRFGPALGNGDSGVDFEPGRAPPPIPHPPGPPLPRALPPIQDFRLGIETLSKGAFLAHAHMKKTAMSPPALQTHNYSNNSAAFHVILDSFTS